MNAPHEMTAWRALMPTIARVLLGDENKSLSTAKELRFGNKGSVAVDTGKGTWFDHEAGHGGGVIDLVQQYIPCPSLGFASGAHKHRGCWQFALGLRGQQFGGGGWHYYSPGASILVFRNR